MATESTGEPAVTPAPDPPAAEVELVDAAALKAANARADEAEAEALKAMGDLEESAAALKAAKTELEAVPASLEAARNEAIRPFATRLDQTNAELADTRAALEAVAHERAEMLDQLAVVRGELEATQTELRRVQAEARRVPDHETPVPRGMFRIKALCNMRVAGAQLVPGMFADVRDGEVDGLRMGDHYERVT